MRYADYFRKDRHEGGYQQHVATDGTATDNLFTTRYGNGISNEPADDAGDVELVNVFAAGYDGRDAKVNADFGVHTNGEGSHTGGKASLGGGETLTFDLEKGTGQAFSFTFKDVGLSGGDTQADAKITFLAKDGTPLEFTLYDVSSGDVFTQFVAGFDKVVIEMTSGFTQLEDVEIGTSTPTLPEIGGTWFHEFKHGIGFNLLGGGATRASLDAKIEMAVMNNNGIDGSNSGVKIGRLDDVFLEDGSNARAAGAFGPDLLIGDTEGGHQGQGSTEWKSVMEGSNHDGDGLGDVMFGDYWENNLAEAAAGEETDKP